MNKSRFQPPYTKEGKTNFRYTFEKCGVYLIQNKKGKIVYVGESQSNLYKTMYRHFQNWTTSQQVRAVYPKQGYTVRVVLTKRAEAPHLEMALILKYKPRDNPNKLQTALFNTYQKNQQNESLEDYSFAPAWTSEQMEDPF